MRKRSLLLQYLADTPGLTPAAVPDVDDAIEAALIKVEDTAEAYRARFINTRPGKQAEYREKVTISEAALAGDEEAAALLAEEAGDRDMSVEDLARLILEEAEKFRRLAMIIGAFEGRAKAAVAAVRTAEEIDPILAQAAADAEARFAELSGEQTS